MSSSLEHVVIGMFFDVFEGFGNWNSSKQNMYNYRFVESIIFDINVTFSFIDIFKSDYLAKIHKNSLSIKIFEIKKIQRKIPFRDS